MTDEKHPGGRPLKFESVEELQAKIDAYFKEMDREEDTRDFADTKIIDDDYDVIEKDVRVSKKRIICEACRRNSYEPGCKILSGELKLRRPYTVTGLALGEESFFVFSTPSKNDLYVNFETAIFREPGDPLRLRCPADHALSSEFEEQMLKLVRKYVREGEYLSVHHPDDAPDGTALAPFASKTGKIGDILFG